MNNQEITQLLNRAAAALETPADLRKEDVRALVEDLTAAAKQSAEPPAPTPTPLEHPPTIVLDLSGGVLQAAYTRQPVDIIVIDFDKDTICEAESNGQIIYQSTDGSPVYMSSTFSEIEPEVVDHYLSEQNKD